MTAGKHQAYTELDDVAFAELVADTWRRHGWEIVGTEPATVSGGLTDSVADGCAMIVRSTERRYVLVVPGPEKLSAGALLKVRSAAPSPSDVVVVSAAGFDTGALSVADAYGMNLIGPGVLDSLDDDETDD